MLLRTRTPLPSSQTNISSSSSSSGGGGGNSNNNNNNNNENNLINQDDDNNDEILHEDEFLINNSLTASSTASHGGNKIHRSSINISKINPEFFQRVTISEDPFDEVSQEIQDASKSLIFATELRKKYQKRPARPAPYWGDINEEQYVKRYEHLANTTQDPFRKPEPLFDPFDPTLRKSIPKIEQNEEQKYTLECIEGVFHVFEQVNNNNVDILNDLPTQKDFFNDLQIISKDVIQSPACKSHCFKRLQLLEARFNFHIMLNSQREKLAQKCAAHRDIYNIAKVDTHVHHSAIMTQKHLLRFIKHKLKTAPDEVVAFRDGKYITLRGIFDSLNLSAYSLSIDSLDMHAHDTFHRFDRFNLKYNPVGETRLREVFLKTDNLIGGRYLAEITKEVFADAKAAKYVYMEPRLSIYGKNLKEWSRLGRWYCKNKLASPHIRWMIQIPRLYQVYKTSKLIESFQQMVENIFLPLFKVTLNPETDPCLDLFLRQVTGFDCVDDESKEDSNPPNSNGASGWPEPAMWKYDYDPSYSYWTYYIYANLQTLNELRRRKQMTCFSFRPHAGEAGNLEHLASAFLCAESINHGVQLRKSPPLQLLYYLEQIGIAVSPLSNNRLFLRYEHSPFVLFFSRGLNVSLSTDDPLMLHVTKDPLMEEYSVAMQVWNLSSVDVSELARNSVLQSGFEYPFKAHFIGDFYYSLDPQVSPNSVEKTNVPNIRLVYRKEILDSEWAFLKKCAFGPIPSLST